jgi:hypothetical protein
MADETTPIEPDEALPPMPTVAPTAEAEVTGIEKRGMADETTSIKPDEALPPMPAVAPTAEAEVTGIDSPRQTADQESLPPPRDVELQEHRQTAEPDELTKSDDLRQLITGIFEEFVGPRLEPKPPEKRTGVRKIIVAIHGIGDQYRNETIQAVAHGFCRYMGRPVAIPLGRFHTSDATVVSSYIPRKEQIPGGFPGDIGFVEVYWANIPREPIQEAHTVEEPKKWARTIVERLRLRIEEARLEQAEAQRKATEDRLVAAKDRLAQFPRNTAKVGELRSEVDRLLEATKDREVRTEEVCRTAAKMLQKEAGAWSAEKRKDQARQVKADAKDAKSAADALEPLTERKLQDYELLGQVIEEIISGVAVAERFTSLAAKMGLIEEVSLKKLLDDYLNDVQLVAEFDHYRGRMLDTFCRVMEHIVEVCEDPVPEIYVVAHSEGTVVSFLGLLEGLKSNSRWIKQVKGFMTIGSPLNKHVILWPDLFQKYQEPLGPPPALGAPIKWRNYYDYGDPVAFDLKPTRDWMKSTHWVDGCFEFRGWEDEFKDKPGERRLYFSLGQLLPHSKATLHDYGFTRYPLPGMAHNGYWRDEDVFGHFIQDVVDPAPPGVGDPAAHRAIPQADPSVTYQVPRTKFGALLTSYGFPYVLAMGLLLVGVYLLYKAVRQCVAPGEAAVEFPQRIFWNVLGIAFLIGGTTVMARIPCLLRSKITPWGLILRFVGIAVFAGGAWGFHLVEPEIRDPSWLFPAALIVGVPGLLAGVFGLAVTARRRLDPGAVTGRPSTWERKVISAIGLNWAPLVLGASVIFVTFATLLHYPQLAKADPTGILIGLAFVVGIVSWVLGRSYTGLGLKPLIYTGSLVILILVALRVREADTEEASARGPVGVAAASRAEAAVELWAATLREADAADAAGLREPAAQARRRATEALEALRAAVSATDAPQAAANGPIWPVVLAGLAFFYLWWLAALTFDLTFVWHRYIHHSAAQEYLESTVSPASSRAIGAAA